MKCARCDVTADDLTEHAQEWDHPLCWCGQSLPDHAPRTCDRCLNRVMTDLRRILELYAVLPDMLEPSLSQRLDRTGSGEPALPGGTALVLLGPGGTGTTGRRLTPLERRLGLTQHLDGREHKHDNQETDPPSVSHALMVWEDDLRDARYDKPAWITPGRQFIDRTFQQAHDYLDVHMRWAANTFPSFPDLASDLRSIRKHLENATGRSDRPEYAPAPCFDCHARLAREWTDQGLADAWTCQGCGRIYTYEAYNLALKAAMQTIADRDTA